MIPNLINLIKLSKVHDRYMKIKSKKYTLNILDKLKNMGYIEDYYIKGYEIYFKTNPKLNRIFYVSPYKLSYNIKDLVALKEKYDKLYQGKILINSSKGISETISTVGGQIICYVY